MYPAEEWQTKICQCSHRQCVGNLTKAMQEKVDSEQGRRIYPQRIAIVEPVFANIRINKRADRFTLRGKIKVISQQC